MEKNSTSPSLVDIGRRVIELEAQSLLTAAKNLNDQFVKVVNLILDCSGKVIVTGIGKSGQIGAKIASTLASTGTPAFFLHASEGMHGDFGMMNKGDILIALTYSGETREVLAVCNHAKKMGAPILGISGNSTSTLASLSHAFLDGSIKEEADTLGLAPTCSSTVCLALGDAIAVALMRKRDFSKDHFAALHPGGKLGKSLMLVKDFMHATTEMGVVKKESSFHDILKAVTHNNFGISAVVDDLGSLIGAVSDGDLRRALLRDGGDSLHLKAEHLMGKHPKWISPSMKAIDAITKMESYKITSLFVLEKENSALLGMVRLHDLMNEKII